MSAMRLPRPPGADVRASGPVPRSVRLACRMILASTLLGLVIHLIAPSDLPHGGPLAVLVQVLLFSALLLGSTIWLIVKIHRGRNWARWTMLLFLAPNWAFWGAMQLPEQITQAPVGAA